MLLIIIFINEKFLIILQQKNLDFHRGFFKLALSAFPGRLQPSIIDAKDFTSVFEMGTGVSP